MSAGRPKSLRYRQVTDYAVLDREKAMFVVDEPEPGRNYWLVKLADAVDHGPVFEIATPKSGPLDPHFVAYHVARECNERRGILTLTEFVDGLATFTAKFQVGAGWDARGWEVCLWSTDAERCPPRPEVFRRAA